MKSLCLRSWNGGWGAGRPYSQPQLSFPILHTTATTPHRETITVKNMPLTRVQSKSSLQTYQCSKLQTTEKGFTGQCSDIE